MDTGLSICHPHFQPRKEHESHAGTCQTLVEDTALILVLPVPDRGIPRHLHP